MNKERVEHVYECGCKWVVVGDEGFSQGWVMPCDRHKSEVKTCLKEILP